ncbi:MAG: hypothetical protein ABIH23_27165 [bacterium]
METRIDKSAGLLSRRGFLGSLGAVAAVSTIPGQRFGQSAYGEPAASPVSGPTPYVLLDRRIVAQAFAMRREAPTPQTVHDGPLLTEAWAYGSVLRDKTGLFRMWYMGSPPYCEYYATSTDGIVWDKPDLNIVPAKYGTGANAFLHVQQKDKNGRLLVGQAGPEGFSVLDAESQPHPSAKDRYTVLYLAGLGKEGEEDGVSGLCIAYSDDGIHWWADEHNPVVDGWIDTSNCLMYDEKRKKYLIFGRPPVHVVLGRNANRMVSCMESDDLIHWSSPRTVFDTDERDADGLRLTDEGKLKDPPSEKVSIRGRDRQFYGMTAFMMNGLYIGLPQVYDIPSGNTWLELCHSSDGRNWLREPLREPYIGPRSGTWESRQVRPAMATPPVRVGDELWIYYSASPDPHHAGKAMKDRGIGCRSLKIDRWVAYRSEDMEAELLTHPLEAGERLFLNAKTEPDGWIRVAVVEENGRDIEGLTREDCAPITGDSIRHEVLWKKATMFPKRPIRLRIFSCHASLYAFYS